MLPLRKLLEIWLERRRNIKMTRNQIEKFAGGYPVPTDWVAVLIEKYNIKIKFTKYCASVKKILQAR